MSRRYELDDAWIELPDKWLGEHAARRDEARDRAIEAKLPSTFVDFSISMALLDNWSIPGLGGNPEKWDFNQLELEHINWVIQVALVDFSKCWAIPKNSLTPSSNGLTAETVIQAPGPTEGA